jgi:hypothetical protein
LGHPLPLHDEVIWDLPSTQEPPVAIAASLDAPPTLPHPEFGQAGGDRHPHSVRRAALRGNPDLRSEGLPLYRPDAARCPFSASRSRPALRGGKVGLEEAVIPCGLAAGLQPRLVLINSQRFTKTANCWGVQNGRKGTNTNRVVVFRKPPGG